MEFSKIDKEKSHILLHLLTISLIFLYVPIVVCFIDFFSVFGNDYCRITWWKVTIHLGKVLEDTFSPPWRKIARQRWSWDESLSSLSTRYLLHLVLLLNWPYSLTFFFGIRAIIYSTGFGYDQLLYVWCICKRLSLLTVGRTSMGLFFGPFGSR